MKKNKFVRGLALSHPVLLYLQLRGILGLLLVPLSENVEKDKYWIKLTFVDFCFLQAANIKEIRMSKSPLPDVDMQRKAEMLLMIGLCCD